MVFYTASRNGLCVSINDAVLLAPDIELPPRLGWPLDVRSARVNGLSSPTVGFALQRHVFSWPRIIGGNCAPFLPLTTREREKIEWRLLKIMRAYLPQAPSPCNAPFGDPDLKSEGSSSCLDNLCWFLSSGASRIRFPLKCSAQYRTPNLIGAHVSRMRLLRVGVVTQKDGDRRAKGRAYVDNFEP